MAARAQASACGRPRGSPLADAGSRVAAVSVTGEIRIWRGFTCSAFGIRGGGRRSRRSPRPCPARAPSAGYRAAERAAPDLADEPAARRRSTRARRRLGPDREGAVLDRDVDVVGLHARERGLDEERVLGGAHVERRGCRGRSRSRRSQRPEEGFIEEAIHRLAKRQSSLKGDGRRINVIRRSSCCGSLGPGGGCHDGD